MVEALQLLPLLAASGRFETTFQQVSQNLIELGLFNWLIQESRPIDYAVSFGDRRLAENR